MSAPSVMTRPRNGASLAEPEARRPADWPARVHAGSLAVGYLLLLGLMKGNWFRGDDFEFLANRVGSERSLSIWYPHNEHWSTAPIAVWRALYAAFGVDSALPYFACMLAAHAAAAHLLWRLMLRAGASPWVSTGLAAVFLGLGAGWENITWAFQLGFLGAFALGLGATLLSLRDDRVAVIGTVALLVVALTFAGVALPFAVSTAACLLLRGRYRRALVLAAVTGGVFLAWYAAYGRLAPPAPHTRSALDRAANTAGWAWQLLDSALQSLTSLTGLGGLLTVALIAYLVLRLRASPAEGPQATAGPVRLDERGLVLAVLAVNLAVQVATLAIPRNDVSAPTTSRYLYLVIAMLLPLVAVALTDAGRRAGRLLPLGVVAYLLVTQVVVLVAAERQFERSQLRADVVGLAALMDQRRPVADTFLAVDLTTDTIEEWRREGALEVGDVPDQTVLDAAALGLVTTSPDPATAAPGDALVGDVRLGTVPGACAEASVPPGAAAAVVDLSPGQTVSATLDESGQLAYQVLDGTQASRVVHVPTAANSPVWLGTTERLRLRLVADAGQDITVCNPGPPAVIELPED